jgi:hypothetical protein
MGKTELEVDSEEAEMYRGERQRTHFEKEKL